MFEDRVRTKSMLTDSSNDVSFTLPRKHDWCRTAVLAEIRHSFLPLSFSVLAGGDPFRIYAKSLRILKLESSRQPMVNFW